MVPLVKLQKKLEAFSHVARSMLRDAVSVARDPIKLWNLGLEVVLRLNSHLGILPVTLSRTDDQDGIRTTMRVSTSEPRGPYLINFAIAIHISFYV